MKVSMTDESKLVVTLAEAPAARRIILDMKEDETSAAEYALRVAEALVNFYKDDYPLGVLKASARIAKNNRVYDKYCDGSGTLDVWIEAIAQTPSTFYEFGAYLSDIWELGDNNESVLENMFIRRFVDANYQ